MVNSMNSGQAVGSDHIKMRCDSPWCCDGSLIRVLYTPAHVVVIP